MSDRYAAIAERICKSRIINPTLVDVRQVANILRQELQPLLDAARAIDRDEFYDTNAALLAELEKWHAK